MNEDKRRSVVVLGGEAVALGPDGRGDGRAGAPGDGNLGKTSTASREASVIPDPEVAAQPKRRRFSAAYKMRVVEEAEACMEVGAVGALLRREGLYSSQLSAWRKQYRAGALQALRDDKRGRKVTKHPLEDEVARLRKQNERLSLRLEQAEAIMEIQKKVAAMLGNPLDSVARSEGE